MPKWSRARPATPGFYWWRADNPYAMTQPPAVAEVVRDYRGELSIRGSDGNVAILVFERFEPCWWYGPLEPPAADESC